MSFLLDTAPVFDHFQTTGNGDTLSELSSFRWLAKRIVMGCSQHITHLVLVRKARSDHPSGRRMSRSSAVTSNLLLPRLTPPNMSSNTSWSIGILTEVRRRYPFSRAIWTDSFCPISQTRKSMAFSLPEIEERVLIESQTTNTYSCTNKFNS